MTACRRLRRALFFQGQRDEEGFVGLDDKQKVSTNRKLAFCLFKYFPFGGLQRDFIRIAKACISRGYTVDAYAGSWQGDIPDGINVTLLPMDGMTNHRRYETFARALGRKLTENSYAAVVGFNKMPGLDVYYAADTSFAAKAGNRSIWYRITGRCRTLIRLEKSVFDRNAGVEILLITDKEKEFYMERFGTPEKRFHSLPPGISRDRIRPDNALQLRGKLRKELGIDGKERVLLIVGTGFQTKGLDRAIRALAALPEPLRSETTLLVVGDNDNTESFQRLARRNGVHDRVRFLGGRDDVPHLLVSADLLIHPAYRENTGTVLIEAMAAELPVLVTDVCGYAFHVARAGAGLVVPSPFKQESLNGMLLEMLTGNRGGKWRENARRYIAETDVFSLPERAAEIIEKMVT